MIFTPQISDSIRFILLALRTHHSDKESEEFLTLYRYLGDTRVIQIAKKHYVEAPVACALVNVIPETELAHHWKNIYYKNTRRVTLLINKLDKICKQLELEGIRCAAIEGGGVMLASSMHESAYGSSDIDILIEPGHDQIVNKILSSTGFHLFDREGRRATSRKEYRSIIDEETTLVLDIGNKAFERFWTPLEIETPTNEWLLRIIPSSRSSNIPVLEPTDLLLQVTIHTSTHFYVNPPGLRLLMDVDRVVRCLDIDWKHFVEEVFRANAAYRVFFSLSTAAGLMNTPIPNNVLKILAPPSWQYNTAVKLLCRSFSGDSILPIRRIYALMFDRLIYVKSTIKWLRSIIFPDKKWMQNQFLGGGKLHYNICKIYLYRIMCLLKQTVK